MLWSYHLLSALLSISRNILLKERWVVRLAWWKVIFLIYMFVHLICGRVFFSCIYLLNHAFILLLSLLSFPWMESILLITHFHKTKSLIQIFTTTLSVYRTTMPNSYQSGAYILLPKTTHSSNHVKNSRGWPPWNSLLWKRTNGHQCPISRS